jgi:two-component system, sensor histidine kinase and response regulator
LAKLNSDLQLKVDERTARLLEKKKIIESQNELLQKDIFLKNRILSIIGHDIRSPLSFVTMGLDLIADDNMPDETKKTFIKKIIFSANNLFLLVDNLLSWGMSQNKQLKIFIEEINLSILIERVINHFQPLIENKDIYLIKDIPVNILGWFDENTIIIVLRNLLSNAVKFTPRKGTINLRISEQDNIIEVKVSDTGIGITAEKLKIINDGGEIVSSEGTDQEKGTGLGLILCKELVALNGGVFNVQSNPETGSIFSFTLPKQKPL